MAAAAAGATYNVEFLHIQGTIFSILLGLVYLAGGVAATKLAVDWKNFSGLLLLPELKKTMASLIAAAVCCISVGTYYAGVNYNESKCVHDPRDRGKGRHVFKIASQAVTCVLHTLHRCMQSSKSWRRKRQRSGQIYISHCVVFFLKQGLATTAPNLVVC